MPRRNRRPTRQQASKRSRQHRREARFAFGDRRGMWRWFAHPSHVAGRRYRPNEKFLKRVEKMLDQ